MGPPTWLQLRAVGNSTPARLTLLIPLLGLLLLFSGAFEGLYMLSERLLGIEAHEAMRLSRLNLHFLYFGLVLVAFATLLYNVSCPYIVKMFPGDHAYHQSEMELMTKARANLMVMDLNKKFRKNYPLFTDSPSPSRFDNVADGLNRGNRDYWLGQNSLAVSDLVQEYYRLENTKRPRLRRLIQITWVLGFAILVVPSIATLVRICYSLTTSLI